MVPCELGCPGPELTIPVETSANTSSGRRAGPGTGAGMREPAPGQEPLAWSRRQAPHPPGALAAAQGLQEADSLSVP